MTADSDKPGWLRPLIDFGPLAVFFATYLLWDLLTATGALIVATLIVLAIGFLIERRVAMMPLVTAVIVTIFGGLTLWLEDETFIKMKPTIVQFLFAAVLLAGLAFGKSLLKYVLQQALQLDEDGWRKLTWRWAGFFIVSGLINELVWRTQSTDFWVSFKVFGLLALTLAFALLQTPLILRHRIDDPDEAAPATADGTAERPRGGDG